MSDFREDLADGALLDRVHATRLNSSRPAQAAVFSLPVPPGTAAVTATGVGASQSAPIAWWPDRYLAAPASSKQGSTDRPPRRLLTTLCSDTDLPHAIQLTSSAVKTEPCGQVPKWRIRKLASGDSNPEAARSGAGSSEPYLPWETNEFVITHTGHEIGLRVGLLSDRDGPMWWEWCRGETLWSGPACEAVRVGGYASTLRLSPDDDHPDEERGRASKWLHHRHWAYCEIYALIFANGVVQVTARHVNTSLYDKSRALSGAVPILGVRGDRSDSFTGILSGQALDLDLGSAVVSLDQCASMHSPGHPGRIWSDAEEPAVRIIQPYQGVEINLPRQKQPVPGKLCVAADHVIPAGVGRTVRFCLSLGDAPPRVDRYVLPDWWYGLCAELTVEPLLPVEDRYTPLIEEAGEWMRTMVLSGCFDDGSVPRGGMERLRDGQPTESGWDGDTANELIRYFYCRPSPELWDACIRDLYYLADVAVDHETFMMRMHGFDFESVSITMNRPIGLMQGYLETGDPYLLETAESVALRSSSVDQANWPRRSIGRDAMYIRGLIGLADYFPDRGFALRAREALQRVEQVQRPDGAFAQQSGPGGVHGTPNLVVKPWMNNMVLQAVIDWLERHPDDTELSHVLRETCEYDLAHRVREGGKPRFVYQTEPGPPRGTIIAYHIARTMLFATHLFGDERYRQAWEEVVDASRDENGHLVSPLGFASDQKKCIESLLWYQMHRFRVKWGRNAATSTQVAPVSGENVLIHSPAGDLPLGMDVGNRGIA